MIPVVASKPTIYLANRGTICSHDSRTGRLVETGIDTLVKRANRLSLPVGKVLIKLLAKLSEIGISFKIHSLITETDAEVASWKYAVIQVELDWKGNPTAFDVLCERLIDCAYSSILPEEASKVLVLLKHV